MAKTKAMEAAEQVVARAEADLARAETELNDSTKRVAEARSTAEAASDRRSSADPFAEKEFKKAVEELEIAFAKVEALGRRQAEAQQRAEAKRSALAAAELARDEVRVQEGRRPLQDDRTLIEDFVRETRAKACELVEAHRRRLEEFNALARSVHERAHPDDFDHAKVEDPAKWAILGESTNHARLLGAVGVLGALEKLVDDLDRYAYESQHPEPSGTDTELDVQQRHAMKLFLEAEENRAEEARVRERSRPVSITPEELEYYKTRAIDTKVGRDNPRRSNPNDYTPSVG